jgi:hypothetical protein
MIFTAEQIRELLDIVDYHSSFTIGSTLGFDSLTDYDRFILIKHGIHPEDFKSDYPPYYQKYLWGRLSALLGERNAKEIEFKDFVNYIKRGQYVPLNTVEKHEYNVARNKTYEHIKDFWGKARTDISTVIGSEELKRRNQFEEILGDEIKRGVLERKAVTSIVSEIGNRMQRWDKDYGRLVETEMQDIYNQGRAAQIRERSGNDVLVFKDVFPGACRHCIRLYLTNGIGSEPYVFKLAKLEENGTNIGRKQDDWKPVVGSTHPWCRCDLRGLPSGYGWNEESKTFEPTPLKDEERHYERKSKVRIRVGDKEYSV